MKNMFQIIIGLPCNVYEGLLRVVDSESDFRILNLNMADENLKNHPILTFQPPYCPILIYSHSTIPKTLWVLFLSIGSIFLFATIFSAKKTSINDFFII